MLTIKLTDERWEKTQHGHVLGSAFVKELLLHAEAIDAYLHDAQESQLADRLRQLNGRWAVCLKLASGVLLVATDRTRTWPLFYMQGADEIFLSDNAEEVRTAAGDEQPDPVACEEFLLVNCVTGHDTLFPHVKQMLRGEMLLVKEENFHHCMKIARWYAFTPQKPAAQVSLEESLEQLDTLMLQAHQRLLTYADGRPIYIPLSGGLDSRSVATSLVRLKYDNLHTYCYGDPAASDPVISSEVAKKLNLSWRHIRYSKKMWREEFSKSYFQQYLKKYFQYATTPNIQELPAARFLDISASVPKNVIIAPGQCDAYMGSMACSPDLQITSPEILYALFFEKFYSSGRILPTRIAPLNQYILQKMNIPSSINGVTHANCLMEEWATQEIANKLHMYAMSAHVFFNRDLYYPLCDNDLLDFWEQVPHNLRFNRNLQLAYVQKYYALACGEAPSQPLKTDRDRSIPQAPKVFLKKWRGLIPLLLKYLKRHRILAQNKWGWHYAFPFSYRHARVKEGNLSIDYFIGKYILENFVDNKEK